MFAPGKVELFFEGRLLQSERFQDSGEADYLAKSFRKLFADNDHRAVVVITFDGVLA